MVARAASNFCLLIIMRAIQAPTVLAVCLAEYVRQKWLTRLGEEEEENALESSRDSPHRDHPPPPAARVRECCVDAVRDDLAACDCNAVHDDHTSPKMSGGELLNVERGDTGSDSYADTDEETAANLVGRSYKV